MLDPYAPTLPDQPPPALHDDPAGRRHARFILLEELGRGAMGVVYGAYDPQLDRRIALKILPECGESALAEARALARLHHPNVVPVHEVGSAESHTWLAMTYLEGPTLGAWQASASPADIIATYTALGSGLAAAHAAGVVHRDFKPDNVVFDGDGRPHIIDFGLASYRGTAGGGQVWGTPGYIAPEVLQGGHATPAADQFAFCAALYRALFGEAPYPGKTPLALAVSMGQGLLRQPAARRDVPPWIAAAILRGLAVDPAQRWPSMAALVGELGRNPRSDPTLFAAERARFVRRILVAMTALLVTAVALASEAPTPAEALAWGMVWPVLLGGLLWSARRWIRGSPINCCLARVLVIAAATGLVCRVLTWQLGLSHEVVLSFELVACAGVSAMSVPTLGRWMAAVAAVEVIGAVAAAGWPAYAGPILMGVMVVLVAMSWHYVIRPQAHGEPRARRDGRQPIAAPAALGA